MVGDKKGEKKLKGEKAETKRSKKGKGDKDKPSKKRKKDDDDDHNPLPDGGSDDDEDGDDDAGNFGLEGLEDILKDESDQKSSQKKPATNAAKTRLAKKDGKKHEEAPSKLPSSSTYLFCTCAVVFLKNFYRSQLYSAILGRYFLIKTPKLSGAALLQPDWDVWPAEPCWTGAADPCWTGAALLQPDWDVWPAEPCWTSATAYVPQNACSVVYSKNLNLVHFRVLSAYSPAT